MGENTGLKIIRLKTNAQNLEMWMAYEVNGEEAIGHIFMTLENNNRIKFMDAWVDEAHRRKGIYRMLWETRWEYVNENYKGWTIFAWCKDSSLSLLLEKGFTSGEVVTYVEKTLE
jgi:predicted GNAT family acetyltransferase